MVNHCNLLRVIQLVIVKPGFKSNFLTHKSALRHNKAMPDPGASFWEALVLTRLLGVNRCKQLIWSKLLCQ